MVLEGGADTLEKSSPFSIMKSWQRLGVSGLQVILPERLMERDSTKTALPYGADGAVVPAQKFRDVQKLYAAMTDGKIEYVLYGAENQAEIHYAMAVKNNL